MYQYIIIYRETEDIKTLAGKKAERRKKERDPGDRGNGQD
jgi:hypothetical protein